MTKQISLTQGKFALVDDEDFERASKHRWFYKRDGVNEYAGRYYEHSGKESTQSLHRFIMNAQPGTILDHINRDGLDCRKSNLRFCTITQNNRNSIGRYAQSGYKGVSRASKNRWRTEIQVLGKRHGLGLFKSPEDAARAYDRAAREYFGEFAKTNFPD